MLHQLAANAVALVTRFDTDLCGVADACVDSRSENHADGRLAARGADEKRSLRKKLSAAGKKNDIAEKPHPADFAAILVVDFGIDVAGVGELDKAGGGIEIAVGPGFDAQARRERLFGKRRFIDVEEHELARVQAEEL